MVVVLECSEEVLLGRLRRRGESSGRVDDNEVTIRKRLQTFTNSTLPVIHHYQQLGKVRMVYIHVHVRSKHYVVPLNSGRPNYHGVLIMIWGKLGCVL